MLHFPTKGSATWFETPSDYVRERSFLPASRSEAFQHASCRPVFWNDIMTFPHPDVLCQKYLYMHWVHRKCNREQQRSHLLTWQCACGESLFYHVTASFKAFINYPLTAHMFRCVRFKGWKWSDDSNLFFNLIDLVILMQFLGTHNDRAFPQKLLEFILGEVNLQNSTFKNNVIFFSPSHIILKCVFIHYRLAISRMHGLWRSSWISKISPVSPIMTCVKITWHTSIILRCRNS